MDRAFAERQAKHLRRGYGKQEFDRSKNGDAIGGVHPFWRNDAGVSAIVLYRRYATQISDSRARRSCGLRQGSRRGAFTCLGMLPKCDPRSGNPVFAGVRSEIFLTCKISKSSLQSRFSMI